ncbi:MAG: Mth938-like domain-containing protein [Thermoplasmata archaeon]|nr:Mth938-like domain-containing protein [Thermoplasmata archaeon]
MIDSYSFGKIVIDGQEFQSDVIVYSDHVNNNWWRKSGHVLNKDDLRDILSHELEILVIGTGSAGMLKVPVKTKSYLEDKNIELIIAKTSEACTKFNELLATNKNVVGAFHLTC